MSKPTLGRPKEKRYETPYMIKKIDEYIQNTKKGVPILKECCLMNNWNYDYFMELQREDAELREASRRLLDWKEVKLEKGALAGVLNSTAAIFSLKQLGWRDRPEVEHEETMGKLDDMIAAIDKDATKAFSQSTKKDREE